MTEVGFEQEPARAAVTQEPRALAVVDARDEQDREAGRASVIAHATSKPLSSPRQTSSRTASGKALGGSDPEAALCALRPRRTHATRAP